jgi:hypothetical protein
MIQLYDKEDQHQDGSSYLEKKLGILKNKQIEWLAEMKIAMEEYKCLNTARQSAEFLKTITHQNADAEEEKHVCTESDEYLIEEEESYFVGSLEDKDYPNQK